MPGLLNTAVSGLQVSQTALRTTGHNIANANTPGYSRQRVDTTTNVPNLTGAGYVGNGVILTDIERVVDEFLIKQLRTDTSLNSEMQSYNENIRQLDTLLSDASTGLSKGLERFFSVMENGADDPTSIPSRELIISEASNLVQRFNSLYENIATVEENVNSKLEVAVDQINALVKNISAINNKIAQTGDSITGAPNDFLDQREELLRELSEMVSIDVVDQGGGLLNISIGTGQPLVIGNVVREIALVDGSSNPREKDIAYLEAGTTQPITSFITGGELGGLLEFRDSILDRSFNELGRVAMVLSDSFNRAHKMGVDLNNQFGGDFFLDTNDASLTTMRVFADSRNAAPPDRVLSVELVDSSQLTASDYELQVSQTGTGYQITRESDGAVVFSSTLPASTPQSVEFDGLSLTFVSGSFQSGDRFLIQPTRTAARDIASVLERPDQLAFASPLVTNAEGGNLGNASISAGSVLSLESAQGAALNLFSDDATMNPPLLVRFNTATNYDILDNSDPGNPVDLDPPIRNRTFVPGQENALFSGDSLETMVVAEGASLGITVVANGAAPLAAVANGYPAETYTLNFIDPETGAGSQQVIAVAANSSARAIASQLSDVSGVSAVGRNQANLTGFATLSGNAPLQINLNGVDLVAYNGAVVDSSVPDPAIDPVAFNEYLADRINSDATLADLGLYAVAGTNAASGQTELRVYSSAGDDLNISLQAGAAETLTVADYNGAAQALIGAGAGNAAAVTVGGTLDVTLAGGYNLVTTPAISGIFGDSSQPDFAKSTWLGIDASINGIPQQGDRFTLGFNLDGISDNRNALRLVGLATANLLEKGSRSIAESYGTLVEFVGIETNSSNINVEASERVLAQTQDLRDSVSGVNLDEEAANLIQFEQIYNANAQVIAVARQLFDRLINVF